MTADMAPPFTRWQRLVARFLPWFDPERQDAADARIDDLTKRVSKLEGIRLAYTDVGNRPFVERRKP